MIVQVMTRAFFCSFHQRLYLGFLTGSYIVLCVLYVFAYFSCSYMVGTALFPPDQYVDAENDEINFTGFVHALGFARQGFC